MICSWEVPHLDKAGGIACGVVNILIPGLGLMIAACVENSDNKIYYIIFGVIQLLLCPLILPLIWAWYFGIKMIIDAAGG